MMVNLMFDDKYAHMPWDKIDTVVFDVGNVLLLWNGTEIVNRLVPERPDLHEELILRTVRSPYWTMLDRGSARFEDLIEPMSKSAPSLEPYIRRIMTGWIDLPPIPEGINALKTCKEHGVKLYALTNYADREFAHACHSHDFFSLFDDFIVSSREHLVKPGLEIYAHLIHRFSLDPSRTLFIDDSTVNIEAALEFGLQAICYNREGKLADFFGFSLAKC